MLIVERLTGASLLFLVSPHPQKDEPEVCAEKVVAVVDLYSATADHPEWFVDGVHPNADGNRAIAQAVYDTLFAES